MSEAEALVQIAEAIDSVAASLGFLAFFVFMMLLFKDMGGKR